MKKTIPTIGIIAAAAAFMAVAASAQQFDTSGLELVSRDQVPAFATVWVQRADGYAVPLPCLPLDLLNAPVYALPNGSFLLDATVVQPSGRTASAMGMALQSDSEEGGDDDSPPPPPDIANYQKFIGQAFSVIDTNAAAANDTNLYSACISFPGDTNTVGTLQIARYGADAVIIKANHFDYSAETDRDFALLVCDKVQTPTWKSIDLSGSSDGQDGWLVQGSVPHYEVTEPMFLLVSNINLTYNEFFQAIPYGGPQVQITGAQPYGTVSGTITLQAIIADLSGTSTTNQQIAVTVNGLAARCAVGPTNTISLDTRYAQSGSEEVEVAVRSLPVPFNPQNPPLDAKLEYETTGTLPLDFENPAFLVNASDLCSPDVGTNYILFGVSQPDQIQAVISEPSSGRVLASYAGYVPWATTVGLAWNFTEADGSTPYTNDTYRVHFVANDPTTLDITNRIDKEGVRSGAGVIITYAEEAHNSFLNQEFYTWINQTLTFLYNDIYDQWGLTQYYNWQIGLGRNVTAGYVNTPTLNNGWRGFMEQTLGSLIYSDATIGPTHGSPWAIAANGGDLASTIDLARWASAPSPNWRMRKVAVWSCYSATSYLSTNITGYPTFPDAFGIRPQLVQHGGFMRKNAGLFFKADLDQQWNVAEMEEGFDQLWVTGPNGYPGGCDPTWAIGWALAQAMSQYVFMQDAKPLLVGYRWLIYTSVYDDDLMRNDYSQVKGRGF